MRLRHITFTGIDARTDLQELQAIQQQFPLAEFGVLTSYHWYENGNRYLDPQIINSLRGMGLNLALHVCGQAARDAALGRWDMIDKLTWMNLDLFSRVQLNIANRQDNPEHIFERAKIAEQEVIIQQRGASDMPVYGATAEKFRWIRDHFNRKFSVLLDASGGQGIDTPISIYHSDGKTGYAGGISPDNVADKLTYLFENVRHGEFWIDMESGVRTYDWFDLYKVRCVLETCKLIIKEYIKED